MSDDAMVIVCLSAPDPVCASEDGCDDPSCLRCTAGDCGEDARGNVRVVLLLDSPEELLRILMGALHRDHETGELDLGIRTVSVHGLMRSDWFKPADEEAEDT
jgi:hypothetical protein